MKTKSRAALVLSDFLEQTRLIEQPQQFNYEVTRDSIRHFAQAIENTNGVFVDEEFALQQPIGGIVAPPCYLYSHGNPGWIGGLAPITTEDGTVLDQMDNAGETWEFYKPVRPGDIVHAFGYVDGIDLKETKSLGAAALLHLGMRYVNQRGETVARLVLDIFRFSRSTSLSKGSLTSQYPEMEEGTYTRNIPYPIATHGHRPIPEVSYFETRWFEDVAVDDLVSRNVGPIMANHMGRFTAATCGSGYDRFGAYQHMPDGYAFGELRSAWFGAMLSEWAGANGWVTRFNHRNVAWILIGFRVHFGAKVTQVHVNEAGQGVVDLEMWCDSELGFRTNVGSAQIVLPRRNS